jgi:hypothetical protein
VGCSKWRNDGSDPEASLLSTRCGSCQFFAEARDWAEVQEFIDLRHSGAKAHRPALDPLRQAARHG